MSKYLTWIGPTFANSVDPDQLASEEANWYGSALFVIQYDLCQQSGLSNLIGWKFEKGIASWFIKHYKGYANTQKHKSIKTHCEKKYLPMYMLSKDSHQLVCLSSLISLTGFIHFGLTEIPWCFPDVNSNFPDNIGATNFMNLARKNASRPNFLALSGWNVKYPDISLM